MKLMPIMIGFLFCSDIRVEVECVIQSEDYYPHIGKGSIVVLLRYPTTKEQIRAIAWEIRNAGNRKRYNPFFISYYLPGMEVGAGSYASSHFRPELEVMIYESALENNPPEEDSSRADELFGQAKQEGTTYTVHSGG